MASFDSINYSLRPNKHIERALVFEGAKKVRSIIDCAGQVYVGFGSVWFVDFQLAHRALGIREMWSIEADEVGYSRAIFNRPFKTIEVSNKSSNDAIPELLNNPRINTVPWLIWLDYDSALDEGMIQDVRLLVESAPPNSILLMTFSATQNAYGKPNQRASRLRSLLGAVVPDGLSKDDCTEATLPETLVRLTQDFLISVAGNAARPGGYHPAFSMIYADSAVMVTVGGVLPALGAVPAVKQVLADKSWPGKPSGRICAPPLTLKEAAVLQAQLPRSRKLTRAAIQKLGFDLRDDQIEAYQRYYLYYPSFAQITV